MLNKSLIIILLLLMINVSCKKDFTTVGNQLIDNPYFKGKLYEDGLVKIYDQSIDKVYATNSGNENGNNLQTPAIGIYKDDVFGTLKADLVTTLSQDLAIFNEDFENVQILDARLMIPYFSTTEKDGENTIYKLDSVYNDQPFQIKIYEINYLLESFDPNTNLETHQKYFSDFDFTPFKNQIIGDTIGFTTSNEPIYNYKRNEDGTYELDDNNNPIVNDSLPPHLVVHLDKNFFQQKIFDHLGEDILTSSNLFKDYFRGIYIEAIPENNDGTYIMFNSGEGKIQVDFTYEKTDDNGTPNDPSDDTTKTIYKEMTLSFEMPNINIYNNTLTTGVQNSLNTSDPINGDAKIYIKGNAVSEAIIQLFDDQQLYELRNNNWLINQAELHIYVDQNISNQLLTEAQRLLLYNYDDQYVLADILAPENFENGYREYDGKIHTDDNGDKYYKFGITRHIRNVINNDSTNVKLGLRVTTHIPEFLKINNLFLDPDAYNPSGIILNGNLSGTKPPVLKIYYSEPE